MRRLAAILCLLAAAVSVGRAYEQTAAAQVTRMVTAAAAIGSVFVIPVTPAFASPTSAEVYVPIIEAAASASHVNVFRTTLGYSHHDVPQIVQYIYLTGPTRFFQSFNLRSGHWLGIRATQHGSEFLSSEPGNRNPHQVGRLAELVGLPKVAIRPLNQASSTTYASGDYYVEASTPRQITRFLHTLATDIAAHRAPGAPAAQRPFPIVQSANLPGEFAVPWAGLAFLLYPLQIALMALTAAVLWYFGAAQSKRIAIMRLSGHSPARIWWMLVGRFMLVVVFGSVLASVLAVYVLGNGTAGLASRALRTGFLSDVLALGASLTVWLYSHWQRVSNALKGRKRLALPITFTILSQTGVLAASVLLSLTSWTDATLASQRLHLLDEQATRAPAFSHYGLFTQSVGMHYLDYIQEAFPSEAYIEARSLYPYLNSRGALLINALGFEPGASVPLPVLTVNPNYLRAFPLHTPSGKRIEVGDTRRIVLLLPETDRASLRRILAELTREEELYPPRVPIRGVAPTPRRQVEVIWYSDQRVQTLDPLVAPLQGCRVANPVIEVATMSNSTLVERVPELGGIDTPLKVPLVGSAKHVYAQLLPELHRLHLAQNLSGLRSIRSAELDQIRSLRRTVLESAAVALACLLAGVLLSRASLTLIFSRYQRRVIVRRFHGLGLLRSYVEWSVILGATLLGAIIICLLYATHMATDMSSPALGVVLARVSVSFAAIATVEFVLSALFILRRERHVIAVLLKREW